MSRAEGHTAGHVVVFKLPSVALLSAEVQSVAGRRGFMAEFLGTLLLAFFTFGVVIVTGGMLGEKLSSSRLLVMALGQGLAFGLLVFAMAGLSAGHLNPILTVAAMVTRHMSLTRALVYLAAQLGGAVVGSILLKLALPGGGPLSLGLPALGAKVTTEGAILVEGMLAFTLTMVYLITNGRGSNTFGPVVLGLTTGLGKLFGTALTGAMMNPALAFGIVLATGMWAGHWMWWLGPLMGATLAAVCWRAWLSK